MRQYVSIAGSRTYGIGLGIFIVDIPHSSQWHGIPQFSGGRGQILKFFEERPN